MDGLPQAGVLANKLLKKRLMVDGYKEVFHTPGLFKHKTQEICFTSVVDDFGIKYGKHYDTENTLLTLKKTKKLNLIGRGLCTAGSHWN